MLVCRFYHGYCKQNIDFRSNFPKLLIVPNDYLLRTKRFFPQKNHWNTIMHIFFRSIFITQIYIGCFKIYQRATVFWLLQVHSRLCVRSVGNNWGKCPLELQIWKSFLFLYENLRNKWLFLFHFIYLLYSICLLKFWYITFQMTVKQKAINFANT